MAELNIWEGIFTIAQLKDLNERNADKPSACNDYEIEGKRYSVISHFVGNKGIEIIIKKNAMQKAFREIGL